MTTNDYKTAIDDDERLQRNRFLKNVKILVLLILNHTRLPFSRKVRRL